MQTIVPNLWFNGQVEEALELYTSAFPNTKVGRIDRYSDAGKEVHGHDAGDVLTAYITIEDFEFIILNGGPDFSINPSISFTVNCATREELDHIWAKLADGGSALMPLDTYPFSDYYGWLSDRFGVSWQLIVRADQQTSKIVPSLLYTQSQAGKAEEAMNFYTSVFPDSHVDAISRYGAGMEPDTADMVAHAELTLLGQPLIIQESAREHEFAFNEGVSLMITVDTQEEIDKYWDQLSAVPEAEACGWLQDKYGVSWQITPAILAEMLQNGTKEQVERVTEAFLKMKKFDIAALQATYDQ